MNVIESMRETLDGTELAVWAFDSIDISNKIKITVTG